MMTPRLLALSLATLFCTASAAGQAPGDVAQANQALGEAQRAATTARRRAELLEAEAQRVQAAADKTARESAALAARIQQAEAEISASEAQARIIAQRRAALRLRLAEKQAPLMRLTAALQRLSRRPVALSLLRPGSTRDAMHLRAMLGSMLPEVRRRTQALRDEIAAARRLQAEAQGNAASLRAGQRRLAEQRQALAALESRQRLASRAVGGSADREAERALALAEQARDLTALVSDLGKAGALRDRLAALPGPVLRPDRPGDARTLPDAPPAASPAAGALGRFVLPVSGRLVTGFGGNSRGIVLAAKPGAQAVAPGAGRVAFAGPYRGYGQIVIIEHPGGWTSLVTGLAQLDARVGQRLVAGSPLGVAGPGQTPVGLELRRGGEPVNPLEALNER